MSNKVIASDLVISEATVKAHLKNIMLKLGASDRTHAVSLATARGYLV
jgi:DNA-binding NarL/FixJ family response regulator